MFEKLAMHIKNEAVKSANVSNFSITYKIIHGRNAKNKEVLWKVAWFSLFRLKSSENHATEHKANPSPYVMVWNSTHKILGYVMLDWMCKNSYLSKESGRNKMLLNVGNHNIPKKIYT